MYSSPAPSIAPTNPVIPMYYPAPQQHNVIYPPHIPQAPSNGLYQMQP
jgi:hypothetical protein